MARNCGQLVYGGYDLLQLALMHKFVAKLTRVIENVLKLVKVSC